MELGKQPAVVINELLQRLGPWYRIKFLRVREQLVTFQIGSRVLVASLSCVPGQENVWVRKFANGAEKTEPSDRHFIDHLNGILAGKTRNDAGELVSQ
jgi:hypothetical protein